MIGMIVYGFCIIFTFISLIYMIKLKRLENEKHILSLDYLAFSLALILFYLLVSFIEKLEDYIYFVDINILYVIDNGILALSGIFLLLAIWEFKKLKN